MIIPWDDDIEVKARSNVNTTGVLDIAYPLLFTNNFTLYDPGKLWVITQAIYELLDIWM